MKDWLTQQFTTKKNSSLYLVEGSRFMESSDALLKWSFNFLDNLHGKKSDWTNSQDVLLMDTKDKFLKIDELKDIFNFLRTNPIELPRKYIIVSDVKTLSEMAQNKLLKVLEEPPVSAVFLFLNPSRVKLLDTIVSRGQKYKAVVTAPESELITPESIIDSTLTDFQNQCKNNWSYIRSVILSFSQIIPKNAQASLELGNIYQQFNQDQTFNNSSSFMAYKLYRFAQKWLK